MRKVCLLLATLTLLASLVVCSKKDKDDDVIAGLKQPTTTQQTTDLSFDLQATPDPEFSETDDLTGMEYSTGSLLDATPLYIERDGYAYRLDPSTLEPIDVPLDPVTHEPVDVVSTSDDGVEGEEGAEVAEVDVEYSPSAEAPTEDTKYPNTGIFLEDD